MGVTGIDRDRACRRGWSRACGKVWGRACGIDGARVCRGESQGDYWCVVERAGVLPVKPTGVRCAGV